MDYKHKVTVIVETDKNLPCFLLLEKFGFKFACLFQILCLKKLKLTPQKKKVNNNLEFLKAKD